MRFDTVALNMIFYIGIRSQVPSYNWFVEGSKHKWKNSGKDHETFFKLNFN
jgi:hypothetical protein